MLLSARSGLSGPLPLRATSFTATLVTLYYILRRAAPLKYLCFLSNYAESLALLIQSRQRYCYLALIALFRCFYIVSACPAPAGIRNVGGKFNLAPDQAQRFIRRTHVGCGERAQPPKTA